ncbi:MAG: D-glycero-beta-D-manno-heptose-7-phosphate kinase [Nitrospirae bacterium]|nr:D-glycero-beta-D-manno-heptose-7-phosphate kinase [Nitrospirota bacterium]
MKNLFKKFSKTGVLVIGDIIVDQYIWGKVTRISPEAPVPVVQVTDESLLLGGAANVAHNIASLGGKAFIAGVIGRDDMGKTLIEKMKENNINTDGVIAKETRPTIVKTRVIAHSQQIVRFDREIKSDISSAAISSLLIYVEKCLPKIKAIIVSDYCKGLITRDLIKKLLRIAGSKVFIAVDPKIGHFNYYKGVHLITPNLYEASVGSGINISDEKSLVMAGKTLMKKLDCGTVLITRGDEGMTLFEKNNRITHVPTFAREVYDVTGAGDTVIATFALCHSAGISSKNAAILANHAAGAVVGEIGTAVATRNDIIASVKRSR